MGNCAGRTCTCKYNSSSRCASGRALARAALGREFPISALSIAERVPRPTIAHVSSRPPSNSVRWVFPSTASSSGTTQFGPRAFHHIAPCLRLIPDIPADRYVFAPAFETRLRLSGAPPLGADLWRCSSPLSPEVLAPEGLCCPFFPRLATSSASLKTSASLPSLAGYRRGLWHLRILLPGLHTFRTSAPVLSRIAACSFRRESGTCTPPFFRTSAGHRGEGRNPWQLQCSRHQLRAGTQLRRLVRSLSRRPSWLLASWADQTEQALSLPKASTSGLPALKSPRGLPDMTTAPNGE